MTSFYLLFTGENKKKTSRFFSGGRGRGVTPIDWDTGFFYLFPGLHCTCIFSMEFFLVYRSIFWFCCHTYLRKILGVAPYYLKFSLGYGYPHLLFA